MSQKTGRGQPERVYAWFLRLYPSRYRVEYSDLMMQAFSDSYRDYCGSRSMFWLHTVGDTVRSATKQNQVALASNAGEFVAQDSRPYVLAGSLLLFPALAFFVAGLFVSTFFHNHIASYYGSPLYNTTVLTLMLIVAPIGAVLANLLPIWKGTEKKVELITPSGLKRLLTKKNVAGLAVITIGLLIIGFVPLHDAGSCLKDGLDPSFDHTIRCIRNS